MIKEKNNWDWRSYRMTEKKLAGRTLFAETITELGKTNERIVTVSADSVSRYGNFPKEFPERNINVGIAEQTMVSVASGLALTGKIPVVVSYANFLAYRALEQIRVDVALEGLNVKMIGSDTAFSSGYLGFTHLALEDMAAIRSLPGIVIVDPADAIETEQATKAIFDYEGPVYMRLRGRAAEPVLPEASEPFQIGKGRVVTKGDDVLIIACGSAVYQSIKAAELLKEEGINATVVNMATVRPLDEELILGLASEITKVVTVEHHNTVGGLGSAVAELLIEKSSNNTLLRLGVQEQFGVTGSESDLMKEFGVDSTGIAKSVKSFLK